MTTIGTKISTALLLLSLTLTVAVLPAQAQAQDSTTALNATSTPTTTPEASNLPASDWYVSEQISGNEIAVGDFVVGPGRSEIAIAPGETVVREIFVTNRISDNREFKLEIEDIIGSADGSEAASLTGETRGPYSIRDYVTVPNDTFQLRLGERARIPVTISIPPDAEPGGFYGSVLVSTVRIEENGVSDGPRSPVIARIGSLFFITVAGAVETAGETKSIDTVGGKRWYQEGPINLGILYENSGSIHVNPYGEISVTNMFGEEVGYIELEPWFVLPKSLRLREVTWDRELLLGRYTVTAQINRGYDDVIDTVTTSFWVLPYKIIGGTFLIILLVIFSFRLFFKRFEFKRKA
jgi:hypothetical protein